MKKLMVAICLMLGCSATAQAEYLFESGDVVVLSESGKMVVERFWLDSKGKPVVEAKVLEEKNGIVTVYDKLTKNNKAIAREFLRLKDSRPVIQPLEIKAKRDKEVAK